MTAPEAQIAMLMTLMRQLQETMRTENGLLRELKLARMRELQSEKAALAERYEIELRRLRQAPHTVAALSDEARRLLESSMRELQAAARANADRLLHARSVVEAVVQTIGRSVDPAGTGGRSYGTVASQSFEAPARVIPVAFDRRC